MSQQYEITPFFSQLRGLIVVPALQKMAAIVPAMDSPAARNLLLGTVAQETGGKFLVQWPSGPAAGLWQMEPATADDILLNFLPHVPALENLIYGMTGHVFPLPDQLAGNLHYACAISRLFYYRISEPLPAPSDIAGLGRYWKTYYNTSAGAGTIDEFVANFQRLIGGPTDV